MFSTRKFIIYEDLVAHPFTNQKSKRCIRFNKTQLRIFNKSGKHYFFKSPYKTLVLLMQNEVALD
jgi:hypothetical protein